jgi:hypothetical protein
VDRDDSQHYRLSQKGDGFMVAFLTAGTFVGIILGMRFNVYVLVPAITLAIAAITLSDIATHQNVRVTAVTTLATVVLLQIGYLGGRVLKVATESHLADAIGIRRRSSRSQPT